MRACVNQTRALPWVRCTGVRRPACPGTPPCQRDLTRTQCSASIAFDPGSFSDGDYVGDEGPRQRTTEDVGRAKFRAILFFTFSMVMAIPFFCLMLILYPFVLVFDKFRRRAEHLVNKVWAVLSTIPFSKVVIEGRSNLPDDRYPAVYVSNHESYMDIFAMFHLGKDFKFVSKPEIFKIPFVGWSMWLTGHIALNREDIAGFREFVKTGREHLENGASLAIFPEGTRTVDGTLKEFKKGAFTIATKAKVPVVPLTILGSGDVMPSGKEGELHPGTIKIIVHPPIVTRGKKTGAIADEARAAIASRLPEWKTRGAAA